jgi:hypothetical protein
MSNEGYGDKGQLTRRNVKIGEPTNNPQDVLDELYEVLLRRGYAICQGNYHGHMMIVLCRHHEQKKLEPVAQVAQIIPGEGIDWRPVGSARPEPRQQ